MHCNTKYAKSIYWNWIACHFFAIDFISVLTSYSDSAGSYLVSVVPLRILYGHVLTTPPGMSPHVKPLCTTVMHYNRKYAKSICMGTGFELRITFFLLTLYPYWLHIRTPRGPIWFSFCHLEHCTGTFWPPHQAWVPMLKRFGKHGGWSHFDFCVIFSYCAIAAVATAIDAGYIGLLSFTTPRPNYYIGDVICYKWRNN
jgi:hypothetical protein